MLSISREQSPKTVEAIGSIDWLVSSINGDIYERQVVNARITAEIVVLVEFGRGKQSGCHVGSGL